MLSQNFSQLVQILGRFKAVEIIWLLAQIQSGCTELFPSLAVPDSGAAPIVALEQNQRAIEAQSRIRRRLLRAPERIAQSRDHLSSHLSFVDACIGECYNFSPLAVNPLLRRLPSG